jgi:hypothetical protein
MLQVLLASEDNVHLIIYSFEPWRVRQNNW